MDASVSPDFIDNAFSERSPVVALSKLGWAWSLRADADKPRFGLTATEYRVRLITIYSGEVLNGGHWQYIFNRGTRYVEDTTISLLEVGLSGLAEVHKAAVECVALESNTQLEEVRSAIESLDSSKLRALRRLDKTFDEVAGRLDHILVEHLKSNREDLHPPASHNLDGAG